MRKFLILIPAGLLMAGLGGRQLVQAATTHSSGPTVTVKDSGSTTTDTDTQDLQQGDQTSPDAAVATSASSETDTLDAGSSGNDNVQEGDQSAPDTAARESSSDTDNVQQ